MSSCEFGVPGWVGTGPGSEERRAIAVVVIGGQTLSLLLTLLVTPVAYLLLDDLVRILGRRRRADTAPAVAAARHTPEAPAAGIALTSQAIETRNGGVRPHEPAPSTDGREVAPPVPGKLETQSP